MKIDLGCGSNKQIGFVGVDRFAIEGVDIVADLNKKLPLSDDSVDLLFASHSLEHVSDLMATVREIYRVCKHGSQLCIVAPYNEQKLNYANPHHLWVFNEHAPRFWTSYRETPVDIAEYSHPHAEGWGLSHSDHSDPEIDIRLVGMEFFYFPDYRYLSTTLKRKMRSERMDVCDQIMYHLIVWKGDGESPDRPFSEHLAAFKPFEPQYIIERKEREKQEFFEKYDQMSNGSQSSALEGEEMNVNFSWAFSKIENLYAKLNETNADLARAQEAEKLLLVSTSEMKNTIEKLISQGEIVEVLKARMIPLQAEVEAANGLLGWYKSKESKWTSEIARLTDELCIAQKGGTNWGIAKQTVDNLFTQLCGCRSTRANRWLSLLNRNDVLWDSVSPAFLKLKNFTATHFRLSFGTKLVLESDLRETPYREYIVPFAVSSLSTVSLAIRPLLPGTQGIVGVEVVSALGHVVAQLTLPISEISPDVPSNFTFPSPVTSLSEKWGLRVFVRDVDVPVSLYELAKCMSIRSTTDCLPFISLC